MAVPLFVGIGSPQSEIVVCEDKAGECNGNRSKDNVLYGLQSVPMKDAGAHRCNTHGS